MRVARTAQRGAEAAESEQSRHELRDELCLPQRAAWPSHADGASRGEETRPRPVDVGRAAP